MATNEKYIIVNRSDAVWYEDVVYYSESEAQEVVDNFIEETISKHPDFIQFEDYSEKELEENGWDEYLIEKHNDEFNTIRRAMIDSIEICKLDVSNLEKFARNEFEEFIEKEKEYAYENLEFCEKTYCDYSTKEELEEDWANNLSKEYEKGGDFYEKKLIEFFQSKMNIDYTNPIHVGNYYQSGRLK